MYYVYFLRLDNGDIYTGFTEDLRRRYTEHRSGKVQSTSRFGSIKLLGYEAYLMESDARRREKFLKTTEGKRLFDRQYKDVIDSMGSSRHATGRHVE